MIRLRFVTGNSLFSAGIRLQARFWCSHVETVMPDGNMIGAYVDTGVSIRPPNHDATTWSKQLFVDLPATPEQENAFYKYMVSRVGTPYDLGAIFGFAMFSEEHEFLHLVCSALVTLGLRSPGCQWFPYPLAIPAHKISPRDLLMAISARVLVKDPEIRGIST